MANEITTPKLTPDLTYYALIYSAGQIWNGTAFETWVDANYATYDVALTELGTSSGRYAANLPGALSTTTLYQVEIIQQVGGSPSLANDVLEATGTINEGTAIASQASVAAIKAKTDNLPSDPADQSLIIAATGVIETNTQDILNRLPGALVSGRMDSSVGAMAANVVTAAAIASAALTPAKFGSSTELTSVPTSTADLYSMVQFVFMAQRNQQTETSTTATVRNDAGTVIGTATTSDDGTTFTKTKYS